MTTAFDLIEQVTDAAITRACKEGMTPKQAAKLVRLSVGRFIERMRVERPALYERFARSLEAQMLAGGQ